MGEERGGNMNGKDKDGVVVIMLEWSAVDPGVVADTSPLEVWVKVVLGMEVEATGEAVSGMDAQKRW